MSTPIVDFIFQPQTRIPSLVAENTTTGELFSMPDFVDVAIAPPVPSGYEPSPLLPREVQESVRREHAAAASEESASVASDGSVARIDGSDGFEHKLVEDTLTWVDVPVADIEAWFVRFFAGELKSHKQTEPIGQSAAKVASSVKSIPRLSDEN